ncbi:MAG TPA: mechanosensitive ion channel domain-containing protein [Variovorax sp.]
MTADPALSNTACTARSAAARRWRALVLGIASAVLVALAPSGRAADAPPDLLATIAAENASLQTQATLAEAATLRGDSELARMLRLQADLAASMQRIDRRAKLPLPGREFVRIVVDQLHDLPTTEALAGVRAQHDLDLEAASDAQLRSGRSLAALSDLAAAAAARVAAQQPPIALAQSADTQARVLQLLGQQTQLLRRDHDAQQALVETLEKNNQALLDFERERDEAVKELTRLLFWVPVPPTADFGNELAGSFAWAFSPGNWRDAGRMLADGVLRSPIGPALAALVACALLAGRRRMVALLGRLGAQARTDDARRVWHALQAFAVCAALALPVPLLLWTGAAFLRAAPELSPFPQALGESLAAAGKLLWGLAMCRWLLDRRSVASAHFDWDEATCSRVAHAIAGFSLLFVPLIFVVTLNSFDHASIASRESLGRLVGVVAMVALAAFTAQLLRRQGPLMQSLALRRPASRVVRWHQAWFSLMLAVPVGVAVLAGAGYFIAADYFFGRLAWTFFLVIGAVILYGFMALWIRQQRANLQRIQSAEGALAEAGAAARAEAPPRAPAVDVAALGEQTRSLLDLFISMLLLVGLWSIWRGSLPALSAIADHALWTYEGNVDGKDVTLPLTVGRLFLSMLVVAITAVLIRHIGALLDIMLLQRLEVRADATYAIKIASRYVLVAVGLTMACGILGISWADVHWLVAALGVGLGFGLQEIVANFVSGLIILAERPVRIGDVVTVDNVTGRVSRIRARATAVIDFDNKEVIIPNKAFITRDVINWTLSNQTTRLILKVGVAYGSDVERVQRLLLEALRNEPLVVPKPPPQVLFMGFGDSSLTFDVITYVDSIDDRMPAQHAINCAIERTLREGGIEIPFPQSDLHIKDMPQPALP